MKITINDYGNQTEFMVVNNNGKQFCFASAQFYQDSSWVVSISSQKGCPMSCTFCDVPLFGFQGNASIENLTNQLEIMLKHFSSIKSTNHFYVHYARMGEPTFNNNVLEFTTKNLTPLVNSYLKTNSIHPVVLTMLPNNNSQLKQFLQNWTNIKNSVYNGKAGLQFSINSTDNKQRNQMFNNKSLSLEQISELSNHLPNPVGSKYTLSFVLTKDTIIDPNKLDQLFDKNKFLIKIAPVHETKSTIKNNLNLLDSQTSYKICKQIETQLLEHGWEVIVFTIPK